MLLTFRTKLLASHIGLVVVIVLLTILELNRALGADLARQLDQRLEEQAKGASTWVTGDRRHPERLAARIAPIVNADVAIFDREGRLVAVATPSSAPGGDDAAGPEVGVAAGGAIGHASRILPGIGEEHFVAVPAGDGLVLRLAAPLSGINATVAAMRQRLAFASLLAVGAALALGIFASRFAIRPLRAMTETATNLARGDYDVKVPIQTPDEFGVLSRALALLAAQLKAQVGALVSERDRLSAILAGMMEGVIVFDRGGRALLANPAAVEVLGAEAPLAGKTLAEAVPIPEVRAFIESAAATRKVGETEIEAAERTIAIYVRPLGASGGGELVAVVRDMTPIRRLLSMRRDFVANVTHELRTPLTAIMGYAETLVRGSADAATQKSFLEIIQRQSARLASLVEGLLRLSALESAPDGAPVIEPVELGAIASLAIQTVKTRAATSEVTLLAHFAHATVAAADPGALEQVVENLLDNAIKYGRRGGTVRLEGERRGARVVVRVIDDGPGIESRHLPRLFERFYRVDEGRSRQRGGTGLGLAIVKHIVEAMRGSVAVASVVGTGTTFTIELPAYEPAASENTARP